MDQPVSRVLADKQRSGDIECISPGGSVAVAVRLMNERRIGSLLVMDGDLLVGIFTERDVLVRVVGAGRDPAEATVRDVMTTQLLTIEPDTTVEEAMRLMTERRCRHLPVLEDDQVVGLISIGDLTRWLVEDQQNRIQDLEGYIMRP
jgi:CBS domain-containing protein